MMLFAEHVSGFKICLNNIFGLMVDRFGDSVPIHIRDKLGIHERKPSYEIDEKVVLYMFLCKIMSNIELLNPQTGKKSVMLFPLVPKTFFLTMSTRMNFLQRSNTSAMTMDMVLSYDCFEIEMGDNLDMHRKHPWVYKMTSDDVYFWIKYGVWALALQLNLYFLIRYRRDVSSNNVESNDYIFLWTHSGLIIVLSLGFMSMWFYSRYGQKVKIATARWNQLRKAITGGYDRWLHIYFWQTIADQVYPVYFSFFVVCCLLGIFLHPFFYSLMLLAVVVLSTTLNYVVKAITTHFHQLVVTVFMMVLVMYCFAVLSAEFFFEKLESNQPGSSFYNCTQMWECVLYVFNYGLRNGGGIGDVSIALNPLESEGIYVGKFLFDVAFFMLINVISLNIIFGIIIDTFAELREHNDQQGRLG
jgi:hypothetical protein